MKIATLAAFLLLLQTTASADFSYTIIRKTTGGAMAAMAAGAAGVSKVSFKGHKMRTEENSTVTLLDFDAQTMTIINNAAKTYMVRSLADASTNSQAAAIDVKETGQHRTINGFDAKEVVITTTTEMMGSKAQVEADLWIAPGVPGAGEMRAFYTANASHLPSSGMMASLTEIQKKAATLDGVPVEIIVKVKPAAGAAAPQMPQMTSTQSAQMDQARARLEALKAQGGPAAAAAEQALARMGGGRGASPAAGNSLIELTIDSTDFSAAAVPDSAFAIPAGYQKTEAR
jgi:hypothetical protein